MQSGVLEFKFKELEKKIDQSAKEYRKTMKKKTSDDIGEKGAFNLSVLEENPEVEASKQSNIKQESGIEPTGHYFLPKRTKDEFIKNTRLIG